MRELDQARNGHPRVALDRVAIVGQGRLGTAIAAALMRAGIAVDGPYGRGDQAAAAAGGAAATQDETAAVPGETAVAPGGAAPAPDETAAAPGETAAAPGETAAAPGETAAAPGGADAVLLCVPDSEIAAVAATIAPGVPLGHCSGATGLDALGSHEAFSLHPLMTVPADAPAGVLDGAGAAVAGSTPRATAVALTLAELLGMRPIEIDDDDRVAYHAAASIASNFLVTLEDAAERVAATAGLPRELLAPLVRATVENWARLGSARALTGPVARGDAETVRRQRAAVQQRAPELLELFDALADATERLAGSTHTRGVAA